MRKPYFKNSACTIAPSCYVPVTWALLHQRPTTLKSGCPRATNSARSHPARTAKHFNPAGPAFASNPKPLPKVSVQFGSEPLEITPFRLTCPFRLAYTPLTAQLGLFGKRGWLAHTV